MIFCWRVFVRSMQAFDPALNLPFNCKKKLRIKSTCMRWIELSLCFLKPMCQLLGAVRLSFCWHEVNGSMQAFDPALNQPFNCKQKLHIKSTCTALDRTIVVLFGVDAPAFAALKDCLSAGERVLKACKCSLPPQVSLEKYHHFII